MYRPRPELCAHRAAGGGPGSPPVSPGRTAGSGPLPPLLCDSRLPSPLSTGASVTKGAAAPRRAQPLLATCTLACSALFLLKLQAGGHYIQIQSTKLSRYRDRLKVNHSIVTSFKSKIIWECFYQRTANKTLFLLGKLFWPDFSFNEAHTMETQI